jgi:hypothetical protein
MNSLDGQLQRYASSWLTGPCLMTCVLAFMAFGALPTGPAIAQEWQGELRASPNACVPGTPSRGWCGDGGSATGAKLASPNDVAIAPDGAFFIADTLNHAVRHVSAAGTITTSVHRPLWRPLDACSPTGIKLSGGQLLFADPFCGHVLGLSSTGEVRTVAGTGAFGFSGDGGLATKAKLRLPTDVEPTPDGNIYVADSLNNRIRVVAPSGIMATVARLPVTGIAATVDGSLVVTDGFSSIRRVDPSGRISTIAGNPDEVGFSGDGGPASRARLKQPAGVAATTDGGFVFADFGNSRIRRVSPSGVITTVAGRGRFDALGGTGFSGDGGPAVAARLSQPCGVATTPDGGILIADTGNDRIRMVSPQGLIRTVAGSGRPRQASFCAILGECGGQGCGATDIYELWNYFYIRGLPLRARRGSPVRVRFVTTRRARVAAKIFRDRTFVAGATRSVSPGDHVIRIRRGLRRGLYRFALRGRNGRTVRIDSARLRVR